MGNWDLWINPKIGLCSIRARECSNKMSKCFNMWVVCRFALQSDLYWLNSDNSLLIFNFKMLGVIWRNSGWNYFQDFNFIFVICFLVLLLLFLGGGRGFRVSVQFVVSFAVS